MSDNIPRIISSLVPITVIVLFGLLVILDYKVDQAAITAGLQQCWVYGHKLWQKECGK